MVVWCTILLTYKILYSDFLWISLVISLTSAYSAVYLLCSSPSLLPLALLSDLDPLGFLLSLLPVQFCCLSKLKVAIPFSR